MVDNRTHIIWTKGFLFLVLLSIVAFLSPFLSNFPATLDFIKDLRFDHDSIVIPLLRSISFATLGATVLVILSLVLAISLQGITINSKHSVVLSVLLIPVILGNVSTAFIWKLLLMNKAFFFQGPLIKFLTLGFMQFWQFGTLFIYLFWLNQQFIDQSIWDYANTSRLTALEKIRDIILPKQKNLSILLFVIGFIFCFYEEAKLKFIFRASRGTNTELVNHWLNRTYQSDSLLNPEFAFSHLSQLAIVTLFAVLLGLVIFLSIKYLVYNGILRSKRIHSLPVKFKKKLSFFIAWILFVFTLFPICAALISQAANFNSDYADLIYPLFLTLFAALSATFTAVVFGMLCRLIWIEILAGFNFKSLFFLIGVLFILLIPPLTILISGFKWMEQIGYSSANINIAWIIGHTLLSFPLLAAFAISTHFRARNNQINYLGVYRVSYLEKIRDLFVLPFRADYLLLLIIAFSLIWNESIINNILSDYIPSFVTELNKTILGRAADYGNGMKYLMVSLLLAVISVGLWNYVIVKSQKES